MYSQCKKQLGHYDQAVYVSNEMLKKLKSLIGAHNKDIKPMDANTLHSSDTLTVEDMEAKKRILVVEDQEDIGALIALNLESMNFDVKHCVSGACGFNAATKEQFDAIILDIMLPDMNGLDICQTLRQQENHTPILMLTAKKSEADRVVGLEVGADDYLTKPFSVRELQARIKALLRRVSFHQSDDANSQPNAQLDDDDTLTFEGLRIDIQKRTVKLNGENVSLTAKEFDLLLYMSSYPGKVFTREQLLNAVWGYQHNGFEHTVNSHINRLRTKLEVDTSQPKYVLTVWGVGYKFYDQ